MGALRAEVDEASRVLDAPDGGTLRAAVAPSAALAKVEGGTARGLGRRDADVEAIRKDVSAINTEVAAINTRMAVVRGDLNGRLASMQGEITSSYG